MMITFSEEEINRNFVNFSELEEFTNKIAMKIGREMIQKILEYQDEMILKNRDKACYRCKGFRKTSVTTVVGTVEYKRRVYVDNHNQAEDSQKHCVFLLDEMLAAEKIGKLSKGVCTQIAERVCENSFRGSAEIVSKGMADTISHETVWNVTQKIGEKKLEETKIKAELAKHKKGEGRISTEILYEEADGIWLKLQLLLKRQKNLNLTKKVS